MNKSASLPPAVTSNAALQVLSEATRVALFESGQVRDFEGGAILYHDGEAAGVALFPLTGTLQMGKATPRGRRQIICNPEGSSCGGLCMLMFHDYALAEARGLEPGRVLVVGRDTFQQQTHEDPTLCKLAWQGVSSCMAHLSNMVAQLSFNKVGERLARELVEATGQDGDQIRLTQAELAARVGTTREVVARSLGELQAERWIRLGRGRIVVLDRAALRNIY